MPRRMLARRRTEVEPADRVLQDTAMTTGPIRVSVACIKQIGGADMQSTVDDTKSN